MIVFRNPEAGHGRCLPPWPILLLGLGAVVLFALYGAVPDWAVYTRAGLRAGEVWRVVSAHLAHTDGGHLTANVVALLALGWVGAACGLSAAAQTAALALGAAAVTAGIWFGRPDLVAYCGLSGILNTLFVLVLHAVWRRTGGPLTVIAALGYVAKVVVEMASGEALFTSTVWPPVAEAHLYGGLAALALLAVRSKERVTPPRTPA